MPRHYYTLAHIVRATQKYCEAYITECYSQEKNVLVLALEDTARFPKPVHLVCECDARLGVFVLRTGLHQARTNVIQVLPRIVGQRMLAIDLHPSERLVRITLDSGEFIHFILFGTVANALHTSSTQVVYDTFRLQSDWVAQSFSPINLLHERLSVQDITLPADTQDIRKHLAECDLLLGKLYAGEVIQCWQKDGDYTVESLEAHALRIAEECIQSSRALVYVHATQTVDHEPILSLIPLSEYVEWHCTEYTNIADAILAFQSIRRRQAFIRERIDTSRKSLLASIIKTQRAIENINRDTLSAQRLQERQLWGELLLSLPYEQTRQRGVSTIQLPDYNSNIHTIALDPKLTLAENATRYFEKAHSSRQSQAGRAERLRLNQARLERLDALLADIDRIREQAIQSILGTHTLSLHAMEKQLQQSLGSLPTSQGNPLQKQASHPYREFDVGEGCVLYVGKSSENNDTLTMKFAKPNDVWLHARGVAGSHAVLRGNFPVGKPPKKVLELSAAITAYYSKARNGGFVPVAYTLKKFVRKPKGSNVGAVVLDREEVIMVKPGLPVGIRED